MNFIVTEEKYNSGFTVDEYQGKISLAACKLDKEGGTRMVWCRIAPTATTLSDKSIPLKVTIGATVHDAIKNMERVLRFLKEMDKPKTATQAPLVPEKDDVPF